MERIQIKCKQAQKEIKKFDCPNLIIFPGNHDYRHTGYLLFRKFFPYSNQIYEFSDIVILTVGTARPDRDEGEVGHRQNVWMEEMLRKYDDKKKCSNASSFDCYTVNIKTTYPRDMKTFGSIVCDATPVM